MLFTFDKTVYDMLLLGWCAHVSIFKLFWHFLLDGHIFQNASHEDEIYIFFKRRGKKYILKNIYICVTDVGKESQKKKKLSATGKSGLKAWSVHLPWRSNTLMQTPIWTKRLYIDFYKHECFCLHNFFFKWLGLTLRIWIPFWTYLDLV